MSLNQARIVTAIFTGLVLFIEVSIPRPNAKANFSLIPAPKSIPTSTIAPTNLARVSPNNSPKVYTALHHLKVAQTELQNNGTGERIDLQALNHTNKAIAEIEASLKLDVKKSIVKLSKIANHHT